MDVTRPARGARLTCAVVTALLGLAAAPLAAQTEAVFREEIDVGLVEIQVVVTDPEGRPVTGLGRRDFELRQDRKRVEISHFSAVEDRRAVVPAAGAGPQLALRTAGDRLYLVIFLDHAHLQPGELDGVLGPLAAFLRRELGPDDRVMLVEANHSLDVRLAFTTVPELILSGLDAIAPQPPRSRAAAEFPRLLREVERASGAASSLAARSRPQVLRSQIEEFADETRRELELTAHQLQRLLPALAGLPGRKQLVYVGGTVPADAGQLLYDAWRAAFGDGSAYQQRRVQSGDEDQSFTAPTLAVGGGGHRLFRAVAETANKSGVTIHALDAGGLRGSRVTAGGTAGGDLGGGVAYGNRLDAGRRLGDPQVLAAMAEATGGRALAGSRDFAAALDGVASDLETYYVLAFHPPELDDAVHGIEVGLKGRRGKLTVRHPETYRSRDHDRVAVERAITALLLGELWDPIGVELAADPPRPGAGGEVLLPLKVVFPVAGLTLVPEGGRHVGQVSLYLTCGDLGRGAAPVQKAVVPLAFTADQLPDAMERSIEYRLDLPMPAGSPRVAVALRDDLRPLTATAVLQLALPAVPGGSR